MLVFILLLALGQALKQPGSAFWRSAPEFWIYPLQTLLCAAALFWFRRDYEFHPLRRPLFSVGIALLIFVLWIAPQQFLRFPARVDGFNPNAVASAPAFYWTTLTLRFLRLLVVVPLVEEIFWRGFLLRYLISEKFETVPFGTFSWFSFIIVTLAFALSHQRADWPAAIVAGALYNFVAYRTRSLTSCVFAHSLTNLSLGLWIIGTRQWGFW
jgi:hypothetical protein